MFAYCGNNPVNRTDSNGQFWGEIVEFIKTAITSIGNTIRGLTTAYAGCGSLALADGPLPFGDGAALVGATALTVGAVGYGVYQTAKTSARAKPKAKEKDDTAPIEKAVFYGADIRGGTWKTVTEPMNFVEARTWVEVTADTNVYGKGASWGLYTPNELDARMMAISFGGPNPIFDPAQRGIYAHYHVEGRNLFGQYKHFHIWYGAMG